MNDACEPDNPILCLGSFFNSPPLVSWFVILIRTPHFVLDRHFDFRILPLLVSVLCFPVSLRIFWVTQRGVFEGDARTLYEDQFAAEERITFVHECSRITISKCAYGELSVGQRCVLTWVGWGLGVSCLHVYVYTRCVQSWCLRRYAFM